MYFLNEEDKRLLLRRIMPQARQREIAAELRGWNWDKPPLSPIYDIKLGVFEVANNYCPSNRDIYLRRVMGIKTPANRPMLEGGLLHEMICRMIVAIKRVIYVQGTDCLRSLNALDKNEFIKIQETAGSLLSPEDITAVKARMEVLWEYEYHSIYNRMQNVLAVPAVYRAGCPGGVGFACNCGTTAQWLLSGP